VTSIKNCLTPKSENILVQQTVSPGSYHVSFKTGKHHTFSIEPGLIFYIGRNCTNDRCDHIELSPPVDVKSPPAEWYQMELGTLDFENDLIQLKGDKLNTVRNSYYYRRKSTGCHDQILRLK